MLITCARRSVYDQIVQILPNYISQKLLYQPVFSGAPPDDRLIFWLKHETYRHDCEVVFDVDWAPPIVRLMDLLSFEAHHSGHWGPADIDVKEAYIYVFIKSQAQGDLGWHGGLADSAFARQYQDHFFDVW